MTLKIIIYAAVMLVGIAGLVVWYIHDAREMRKKEDAE